MGGPACVFYGAAEFSRDTDLVILASSENLDRFQVALTNSQAERPLLGAAIAGDGPAIERALVDEEWRERDADRAYWQPLRAELERLRHGNR